MLETHSFSKLPNIFSTIIEFVEMIDSHESLFIDVLNF